MVISPGTRVGSFLLSRNQLTLERDKVLEFAKKINIGKLDNNNCTISMGFIYFFYLKSDNYRHMVRTLFFHIIININILNI